MTSDVIDARLAPGEHRVGEIEPTGTSTSIGGTVTAYAIANLRTVDFNDEIVDYLLRIDATLEPYEGRFLVHGGTPEQVDGDLPGAVVVIAFPDTERARAWYASPAYQAILPLRTRNSTGGAIIVDGVPEGYRAAALVTPGG